MWDTLKSSGDHVELRRRSYTWIEETHVVVLCPITVKLSIRFLKLEDDSVSLFNHTRVDISLNVKMSITRG